MPNPQQIECEHCRDKIWVIAPDDIFTKLIRNRKSNDMRLGSIYCPMCNKNNEFCWSKDN